MTYLINYIKLAKQQPVYMYHGTSYRNLEGILSQGLVNSPKKKVWEEEEDRSSSFFHPSRASVGGVYFTKNLMTSIGAAGNSNKEDRMGSKIIVIAQIMPGSLYADEDTVHLAPVRMPESMPNERLSCYLYIYRWYGDLLESWDRESLKGDWERSRELYVTTCLERVRESVEGEIHSGLEERLRELFREGFETALKRQVGHVDSYIWRGSKETLLGRKEGVEGVEKCTSSEGEGEYRRYMDKVSRVLRVLALSEIARGGGIRSGRVAESVGYRGGNKIVAIIRLTRERGSYKIEVVWKGEEGIPEEAKRDFRKQYGENIDGGAEFPAELL